jgi:hypothetical protein
LQSPIRALLYGIAIWFAWVSLIVFSAEILPTGISGSPLFISMPLCAMAALVLGSAILYLRKVGESFLSTGDCRFFAFSNGGSLDGYFFRGTDKYLPPDLTFGGCRSIWTCNTIEG